LRLFLRPKFIASKICLSYHPGKIPDGLGAQLQRIIAIKGLGSYLNLNVLPISIKEIAIHPLDNLSLKDYNFMISNVNKLIGSIASMDFPKLGFLEVINLTPRHFFIAFIKSLKLGYPINLKIRDPYFLVDANTKIYHKGISEEMRGVLSRFSSVDLSNSIVVHHRHGVGGMAIQPGQKTPREMKLERYLKPLLRLTANESAKKIVIFTDAPQNDIVFKPSSNQYHLWQGLPRFDNNEIKIEGGKFTDLEARFCMPFDYRRGGNPLTALADLATSKSIVLSRSSFGYVAALFANNSTVWLPKDFWHPKHSGWKTY
jgi:hypothetical protein